MEGERMRLAPMTAPAPAPSPGPVAGPGQVVMTRARQDSGSNQGVTSVAGTSVQVRQEPLFHSVPPRPQRLLHSEAYIKYIEVR